MIGSSDFKLCETAHREWPEVRIRRALSGFFASTAFSLCPVSGRISLHGASGSHLQADPELAQICEAAGLRAGGAEFHKSGPHVDLCLEDSLSGLFLSRQIFGETASDWVILHLDDHRDMMPCLLVKGEDGGLYAPETGTRFRAARAPDWHEAISRGTITIGNYLTALIHEKPSGRKLHVRHLRPSLDQTYSTETHGIFAVLARPEFLVPTGFAALELSARTPEEAGTYKQGTIASDLFGDLPPGLVLVHIDLDFFVNDFNGNPGFRAEPLTRTQQAAVLSRMDKVFQALADPGRRVERWVIATSPGFCAARNWAWLLEALDQRIAKLTGCAGELNLG